MARIGLVGITTPLNKTTYSPGSRYNNAAVANIRLMRKVSSLLRHKIQPYYSTQERIPSTGILNVFLYLLLCGINVDRLGLLFL